MQLIVSMRLGLFLAAAGGAALMLAAAVDHAQAAKSAGAKGPAPIGRDQRGGTGGIKAPRGKMVDERLDPCRRPHGGLHGCKRN